MPRWVVFIASHLLRLYGVELTPRSIGFITGSLQRHFERRALLVLLPLSVFAHLQRSLDTNWLNCRQNALYHCSFP